MNKYIRNLKNVRRSMIPLTRAIDTLIVSLSEENSNIGVMLKDIAEECPDIVTWI